MQKNLVMNIFNLTEEKKVFKVLKNVIRNQSNSFSNTNYIIKLFVLVILLLGFNIDANASLVITQPTGGQSLSTDKATGGPSAGYSALGSIVISESSSNSFPNNSSSKTLIFTAPTNWQFQSGTGTVTFTGTSATGTPTITVTSTTITVTFSTNFFNSGGNDVLSINGIQVQSTSGTNLTAGTITKTGGTFTGTFTNGTVVASLSQIGGTISSITMSSVSSPQTAGTAFSVTMTAKDFFNNTATFTGTVNMTTNAGLISPATSNAFSSGTLTQSFSVTQSGTLKSITATNTSPSVTVNSNSFTVNVGAFTKMQILVPGETSSPGSATGKTGTPSTQTAGTSFSVIVNAVDANWNIITAAPTNTIAITSSDANAVLPSSAALSSGTKTFSITLKTAGTKTVTATNSSDGTKTANTSSSITVSPGAFTKLQILLPGEVAAAGTATGKTAATPTSQSAGTLINVTVNAVDVYWNIVTTAAGDNIHLTSTDVNATIPPDDVPVSGTVSFPVVLKTTGSKTITASDITNIAITSNTSASVTVTAFVTAVDDYFQSLTSGNWTTATTWQSSHTGSDWFTATAAPTSSASGIDILTGTSVYATSSPSSNNLSVEGTYEHRMNGGTIPTATWNTGSTCLMSAQTSATPPSGLVQTYSNFAFNCPGITSGTYFSCALLGNTFTINDTLNIISTGSGQFGLSNSGSNYVANIGTIKVDGGNLCLTNTGTGNTVNVSDKVLITGGTLTHLFGSGSVTFNLAGDWQKTGGTFTPGSGTVIFEGNNSLQTISGNSSTTFNNIILNKGTLQSNILDVQNVITMASGGLTLTNGTFKLSSASTITPFSSAPTLGSTVAIWNNGGTINSGAFSWTINNGGLIRCSAGTTSIGTATGNALSYATGAKLTIDGGILNVTGRICPVTAGSSTITYNQSSGTITVNTIGSTSTTLAPFDFGATGSSFTMSGGTIVIQNASSFTNGDYLNLASTNNVTGGTLQIGNASTASSPTIRINSTSPIYNLTVNATGTPNAQLVTNSLTVKNDLTISGGTLTGNNLNFNVGGNWNKTGGTFTPGTGTVTFNGSAAGQTILGGSATSFYNLTLSNSNGLSITTSPTITNTLSFTSGKITTGANNVTLGSAATTSNAGAGKYIYGNEIISIPNSASPSKTFTIGDATNYTPVTVALVGTASGSGTISANTTASDHSSISTSGINSAKSVNRFWTLTNTGVGGFTSYTSTFTFVAGDVDAGANTANFIIRRNNSSTWNTTTTGTLTSLTSQATITGTLFGDFQIGESIGAPTISCPTNVSANVASGTCAATVTYSAATSASTPTPVITYTQNSGTSFNKGTTTVTASATNINGTATCNFNVIVSDLIAPVFTNCVSNIVASASACSTTKVVTWAAPTATDNCSSVTLTSNFPSGYAFPIGVTTVIYTATDADNNSSTCSFTVTINTTTALSFSLTPTNVSCNGGTNGSITTNVSGGTSSYTYLWNTGAVTSSITSKAAGTYTVTVTDANNCTVTNSATITQPTALSLTLTPTNVSCNGGTNGSITTNVSGGTSSYTYLWNTGAVTSSISSKAAGTYTVTVTDANGCTISNSSAITQPSALTLTLTPTNVSCNGGTNGSIATNVSGGTSSYTYLWNTGAVTSSINSLSPGNFTLTVTDNNGCTISNSSAVTQPNAINGSFTSTNVNCNGGNTGSCFISMTGGTSPYTYLWNTGNTSPTLSHLYANTYTVTVTDNHGCIYNNSISITQMQPGTINAGADQTICSGTTAAVSATTSGLSGSAVWFTTGTGSFSGTNPNYIYTPSATDITNGSVVLYCKEQTPSQTCIAVSDSLILTIKTRPAKPIITGNLFVCRNNTSTYQITNVDTSSTLNVLATTGATIVSVINNIVTMNFTTPNTYSGTYIWVLATNSCGVSDTGKIWVQHTINNPQFNNGPQVVCKGSTIIYTLKTNPGMDSTRWTVPANVTLVNYTDSTATLSFSSTFTNGTLTVTSYCMCGSTVRNLSISSVSSLVPGNINGQASSLCDSTASFWVNSVTGATGYQWTIPAGATVVGSSTDTIISIYFSSTFTTGTLSVSSINSCGAISNPRTLTVKGSSNTPTSITGPTTSCAHQVGLIYTCANVVGAYSYNWTVPSGATITSGQGTNSITVKWGTANGNVMVNTSRLCGTASTNKTLFVTVNCRISSMDNDSENKLIVFPNPSHGQFKIFLEQTNEEPATAEIFDLSGRMVWLQGVNLVNGVTELNVDVALSSGSYILSLTKKSGELNKKIIIE